ncbi:MAG: LamG-like jellyroll fold domain-containing protein [Methylotetracoccus sp.]
MALQFSSLNTALTRTAGLPASYNPITITGWVRIESSLSGVAYPGALEIYAAGSSTFSLSTNNTNNYNLSVVESYDSVNYTLAASAYTNSIGEWAFFALVYDGTNNNIRVGPGAGDLYYKSSAAKTGAALSILTNLSIGSSPFALNSYWRGSLAGLKFWARELTADEINREARCYLPVRSDGCFGCYPLLNRATGHLDFSGLRQDLTWGSTLAAESDGPSGVRWAPQTKKSRVLIQTAWRAGNTYTLTADTGSIAIAGQAVTLKASRTLVAARGAVAISAQPATLKASRRLVASVANVPVTGLAAGLSVARKLSAATGAVSVTGIAATLKAGRRIAADSANLPISGQALTLSVQRRLVAATGALPITGIAANLYTARRLTAAVGAVPIAAPAVALRVGRRLVADVGAVSINGIAANLYTARRLTAAVGAVPIAAPAVALRVARRLVAASANVPVTGLPAALRASRRVAAAPGQIIIVSPDIALRVGRRLRADVGSVPVFGSPVDLVHGGSAPAVAIHSIEVSAAARGADMRIDSRGAAVTASARSVTIARAT